MRRLLPFLFLTACTATPPLVTTTGPIPQPAYAVAGDSPAAAELQRQLTARGWYAADAPTIIHIGYAAAPRATTACAEPDPATKSGCTTWHDTPQTGWTPFAPPLRHHLSLFLESSAKDLGPARIDVTQPGKTASPLPALVTAALAKLPG
nr:hypothetical protein [Polymorphobacter sp.]